MKLEWLLVELSDLQPAGGAQTRGIRASRNAEAAADEWIRHYVRNEKLAAPESAEVIALLLVRAAYGVALAKLLPIGEANLSLEQSMRIVEVLMIDYWRHYARQQWLGQSAPEPEFAFAA